MFGPNVYMINESAWAVGTPLLTCGDVRDHLHTGGDRTCVVVKAEEFNGYAPRTCGKNWPCGQADGRQGCRATAKRP